MTRWRRHLRGTRDEILAPQRKLEGLDLLIIGVDCSSSVYPAEFDAFVSRIAELREDFNCETHVVYCSHVIHNVDIFEEGSPLTFRRQGGGGTEFRPVFRYAEKLYRPVSGLVYFTDLECDHDYDVPEFPVLWASTQPITNLPEFCHPPHGDVTVVVPN